MSQARQEFLESITEWDHQEGDRVDLHDGEDVDPVTLVVPPGTPSAEYNLLLHRLRNYGYTISKEWADGNEVSQAAFLVDFPDEGGESA